MSAKVKAKTMKCDICEISFTREDNLKRHIKKSHTGPGHVNDLIKCEFCDALFQEGSAKTKHIIKYHTLNCEFCNATFTRRRNKKRHVNNHHMKKKMPKEKCHICQQLFWKQDDLRMHYSNVHPRESSFTLRKSAFNRSAQIFTKKVKQMYSMEMLLSKEYVRDFLSIIDVQLQENPMFKIAIIVFAQFTTLVSNGNVDETDNKSIILVLRTPCKIVNRENSKRRIIKDLVKYLLDRVETLETEGSGYTLEEIVTVEVYTIFCLIYHNTNHMFF